MEYTMTTETLKTENQAFWGTGGRSDENRSIGFRPAFMDTQSNRIYPSRFADGRPAPFHLLDGLPDEVVMARDVSGRVAAIKSSVVSGFLRMDRFFTREEAAAEVAQLAYA
jgi:hypothetical protein